MSAVMDIAADISSYPQICSQTARIHVPHETSQQKFAADISSYPQICSQTVRIHVSHETSQHIEKLNSLLPFVGTFIGVWKVLHHKKLHVQIPISGGDKLKVRYEQISKCIKFVYTENIWIFLSKHPNLTPNWAPMLRMKEYFRSRYAIAICKAWLTPTIRICTSDRGEWALMEQADDIYKLHKSSEREVQIFSKIDTMNT